MANRVCTKLVIVSVRGWRKLQIAWKVVLRVAGMVKTVRETIVLAIFTVSLVRETSLEVKTAFRKFMHLLAQWLQ